MQSQYMAYPMPPTMPNCAPMLAALVTDFAKIHAMKMDAVIIHGLAARPCLSSPLKNPPKLTVFGERRNMTMPYTMRNPQKNIPVVESIPYIPSLLLQTGMNSRHRVSEARRRIPRKSDHGCSYYYWIISNNIVLPIEDYIFYVLPPIRFVQRAT